MSIEDRLKGYYAFSDEVVGSVVELAERQASFRTYHEFLGSVGINGTEPRQLIDIKPKEYDSSEAMLVHLSMANPLDPNNLYSLATLASLYPNRRIVAAAHPSGVGYGFNTLDSSDRGRVAKGDFRPVVSKVANYLEDNKVAEVTQVGTSYGANLVLATSELDLFNVPKAVIIEPASVVKRSILKLALAFKSSEPALKDYVEANGLDTFLKAREDSVGDNNYALGLARLTNIAVSRGIAKGGFEERLDMFLGNNRTVASLVWGTESELCPDKDITEIADKMQIKYGEDAVQKLRLQGQKHALTNDLHLYSAIVAESLRTS